MAATRQHTSTKSSATGLLIVGDQGASLTAADSITITDSIHTVTGSTTINTINGGSSGQVLYLIKPTGATWNFGSSGNIKATTSTPANRAARLFTPDGTTWYGGVDSITVASANTDISVAESGGTYTLTFNPANVTLDEFTGPLAITKGGTGAATKAAGYDALSPTTTRGDIEYRNASTNARLAVGAANTYLRSDGTDPGWSAFVTSDVLPAADTTSLVKGSADATKLLRIEADGITTGTTRVWTAQDSDITVAGTNVAQTITGAQTFSTSITVGSGGAITDMLTGSKVHDFGNVTAGGQISTTVTITGAAVGDPVFFSYPNHYGTATGISWFATVTSANTVTFGFENSDPSSAFDPASFTYKFVVFQF